VVKEERKEDPVLMDQRGIQEQMVVMVMLDQKGLLVYKERLVHQDLPVQLVQGDLKDQWVQLVQQVLQDFLELQV
jgi:hypothetical protein